MLLYNTNHGEKTHTRFLTCIVLVFDCIKHNLHDKCQGAMPAREHSCKTMQMLEIENGLQEKRGLKRYKIPVGAV